MIATLMFCVAICVAACEVRGQTPAAGDLQRTTYDVTLEQLDKASSNQQTIILKEKLADGSYIVSIDGVDYKAVSADAVRSVLRTNEELDKCQRIRAVNEKQIATYEDALILLKKDRALADTQAELESEKALRFKTLFDGEHALRLQAEKLYAPPGKVTGFFQHPFVQIATKVGIPLAQSFLTARRE